MELKKGCGCRKRLCFLVLLKSTSISSKTCNKGMVTSRKDCQKSHTTIIESEYQQNDSTRYVLKRNLKFIKKLYALTALPKEIISYPILPPKGNSCGFWHVEDWLRGEQIQQEIFNLAMMILLVILPCQKLPMRRANQATNRMKIR